MNAKIFIAVAVASAACCAAAVAETTGPVEAQQASQGPAPAEGSVWMSGQWVSEAGQWKWVAEHWEAPPARNASWVAGHWVALNGSWVWVNGAWNVGNESQAQSGPPAPPNTPANASNVAPSTPAPSLQAVYGPDGIDRVPSSSVVDASVYGPVEYVPDYASYDPWLLDPWYWGYGGAYLNLGWGGGYRGYRGSWHGNGAGHGYRHGGYAPSGGYRSGASFRSGGHNH